MMFISPINKEVYLFVILMVFDKIEDCFYGTDTSPWWYVAWWSLLRGKAIICLPVRAV